VRAVLWILFLLALFGAAVLYQTRFTDAARAERDARKARATRDADLPDGWGRAVIGEKSGAPLIDPPPGTRPSPAEPRAADPAAPLGPTQETEHVVLKGQSLSTICAAHYGSGRNELVQALARYNRIERVDAIREGQKIRIPPLESLGVPKR
jgi:nucleoid-associated protein YgaU